MKCSPCILVCYSPGSTFVWPAPYTQFNIIYSGETDTIQSPISKKDPSDMGLC